VQAYQAAVSIDANADFFGKQVLVFLFSAVAFNYVLAFLSNLLSLGISMNSMVRFGTNAAAYLEAVKEIAGPTSLDSVTKVQSAIDSYKIARSLEKMDAYLKVRPDLLNADTLSCITVSSDLGFLHHLHCVSV
jgi:hypothetical protein